MPSPFPGMNPYLEQADVWTDFHQSIIVAIRDALRAQLGPRYIVKIEERLYFRNFVPASRRKGGALGDAGSWVQVAFAPKAAVAKNDGSVKAELPPIEITRTSRVEIQDRRKRQLIAVVEMLTPLEKEPGPYRAEYLLQRRQLLAEPAHLVEIDLFRGGPRMPLIALPPCDYCALVSRAEERPRAGFWPWDLREPMPIVPVPVRSPDPDARLDLQPLLHHCYDSAGYHTYLYDGVPSPALSKKDAAWAKQILHDARKAPPG